MKRLVTVRKYSQHTDLTKDLYPKFVKSFQNDPIKTGADALPNKTCKWPRNIKAEGKASYIHSEIQLHTK